MTTYPFENDINYSDAPGDHDKIKYLSAYSITLSSLFDETLQIINNSIHISDSYQGEITGINTNYGPLGCRDCQIHGSYNGVFFELCQTCAELPDLVDDSELPNLVDYFGISRYNDDIIIGMSDPDSNLDTDDLNEARFIDNEALYINADSIRNSFNENHIRDIIQNFRMPYSSTIQLNIGTNRDTTTSETILQCPICYDGKQLRSFMTFECGHQFCGDCSVSWLRTHQTCPLCRDNVQSINI